MASPLGGEEDANPFIPANYDDVDDIDHHTLNPKLILTLAESLNVTLGYLWEKYDADDYNKEGFTEVSRNASGAYNGGLYMGTLPYGDYEVNIGYVKVGYTF